MLSVGLEKEEIAMLISMTVFLITDCLIDWLLIH